MKKNIRFLCLLALLMPLCAIAQNFALTINSSGLKADTLRLETFKRVKITDEHQRFEGEIIYENVAVTPYTGNAVIKQKKPLKPGYYRVMGDSSLLFELLISEEKKQKITVNIAENGAVSFINSPENSNFQTFQEKSARYAFLQDSLNGIFQNSRNSMPPYMLQNLLQNLQAEAQKLENEENAYRQKVMNENPGTLLASIVKFSAPLPPPPTSIMQDQSKLMMYSIEHAFDHFDFKDGRLGTTPMAMDRLIYTCSNLFYLDPSQSPEPAVRLLNKLQANADNYHAFFNVMETAFGTIGVSFWTEEIYLAMLKNALDYSQLEERRVKYYQQVYELQSKNLAGMQIPDIHIQWGDSSRSSLYAVESEYTLLYLQNPDCHTCTAVRGYLAANEDLNRAIESGKLKVVTLYFDKDEALWQRYLKTKANPKYLHGWDYNGEIDAGLLFDLRAIPVIFLLDKDKRVIKKNIAHYEISDYLKKLCNL